MEKDKFKRGREVRREEGQIRGRKERSKISEKDRKGRREEGGIGGRKERLEGSEKDRNGR